MAFVLDDMSWEAPPEQGVCEPLADGGLEAFIKSLTPEERASYPRANLRELQQLMAKRWGFKYARLEKPVPDFDAQLRRAGSEEALPVALRTQIEELRRQAGVPPGKGTINNAGRLFSYESCTDPEDFPQAAAGYRPYDGKLAMGINLDGKSKRGDFTSPDGQIGIDNALWRVIGCTKIFREATERDPSQKGFTNAQAPTLIEISGVDDPHNDPDVEVTVAISAIGAAVDARGGPLRNASYDPEQEPAMASGRGKGRIVDGVLTTEPFEVTIGAKSQIVDAVRRLRQARIQAKLNDDGTISGGFYGYYPIDSFWESMRQFTQNGADQTQLSCPGVYAALHRYADGLRDPRTHKFTGVSTAIRFTGVPAFIVRPPVSAPASAAAAKGS